ncbi:MAG: Bax inhibitor-1 family protein [Verrucomicrobia bacterium]|nr:Bax inhibitor-1 family protein [Verrucomicrobiota bacterium]MDA1086999.1 Bax inhibitor-1 family protein [Verrucomicrobiota bacterium]
MSMMAHAQTISVLHAEPSARAMFIRRTYAHLAAAIAALVVIEYVLLQSPLSEAFLNLLRGSRYGWLGILGAFMLCGWLARGLAANVASVPLQYLGLSLYVVAWAVMFVPILHLAINYSSPNVLPMAAILTGVMFAGLTAIVFTTRKDFSFLGSALMIGGFVALGVIVCSVIFGFNTGLLFSGFMVVLASGAILYDTSRIMHHYSTEQHVAASLELFASVALLFWYILRIVMSLSRR